MEPGGERKTSPQKTTEPREKGGEESADQKRRETDEGTNETSDTSYIGFQESFRAKVILCKKKSYSRLSPPVVTNNELEQYNTPHRDQTPASTFATFTHHLPVLGAALSEEHVTARFLPSASTFAGFPRISLGSARTHVAPGTLSTSQTPVSTSASFARCSPLHGLGNRVPTASLKPPSTVTFSNPQQDAELSAYKPEIRKIKYSLSHSQSSASSTSDSTLSHRVQSRPELLSWSDVLNRSLISSGSRYIYQNLPSPYDRFHGKETKQTEAAETADTEEDWRPVQSSLVTEDIQDEQRSQKFSPEENIGIFYPKMTLLPLPPMTDSHQQHRHVVVFDEPAKLSACKLEGRRRKHDPSSPTVLNPFLSCGLQLQGHGGLEVDPSLRGRVHPGQVTSQPLGEESLPRPPFNHVLGSPSFTFSESSHLNVNDPFQHLNLKQITKEKIKAPGSNEESEPNISHSRPSVTALPSCSQSSIPTVSGPPECSNEERVEEAESRVFLLQAESTADQNVSGAAASPVRAEYVSATNTLPPSSHLQVSSSCCLTRSHSAPSLSKIPKNNFRRAASLPDMKLKEFTPAISADDCDDETYSFQCSCPGLYQCSVSGLVFNMKGEGGVAYRTVPWNRRLLAQHHKKPAGPLFDIKCLQRSVCQLHLPHCEIISTGGGRSLQVAHVSDEGIEFISPHQVTETHVVVNISGFSAYGNVKDEDSPPDPVRALVLLFYKPPEDPDLTSFLNVLLLPKNVALRDVLGTRKKLVGEERYIETSPHCKLHPKQVYTLSTSPEDDSVVVQPTEAEFDEESYDNYFPSFQVTLEKVINNIKLFLRDSSSSHTVWQRKVYLSSCGVKKSCGPSPLNLCPNERLLNVRSCFIDGISGSVLSSLMEKLLEKTVITDAEREEADETPNRRDRARLVIDTVRRKGEAASSEMIECLSELDPFFCKHLGLI